MVCQILINRNMIWIKDFKNFKDVKMQGTRKLLSIIVFR